MALTKNDLEEISKLFSEKFIEGYQHLIAPHFDHMYKKFDEIDVRFEQIDGRFEKLEEKLDTHIVDTSENFDEVFKLIGFYFEDCTRKEDHALLTLRVSKLEAISLSSKWKGQPLTINH